MADLNLPVRIETCPTVREADGLAMSSRNALLGPDQRERALALRAALLSAAELVDRGERSTARLLDAASAAMQPFGVQAEYLAIVDPDTFDPVTHLDRPALLALAARIGSTRLIDNEILQPRLKPVPQPPMRLTSNRTAGAVAQPPMQLVSTPTKDTIPQAAMPTPDPDQPDQREAQTTCSA